MNVLKQQKKLIAFLLVVVISLSVVTFRHRPNIVYDHNQHLADVQKQQQDAYAKALAEYNAYLKSIEADTAASKLIVQELITPAMVTKQVDITLETSQKIVVPDVPTTKITVAQKEDKETILHYFTAWGDAAKAFNAEASTVVLGAGNKELNANQLDPIVAKATAFSDTLSKLTVPKSVVPFHKSELASVEILKSQLSLMPVYTDQQETAPWKKMYHDYMALQNLVVQKEDEIEKLKKKFAIGDELYVLNPIAKADSKSLLDGIADFLSVHHAQAFIIAPGTPVIVTGDIPREADKFWEQFWGYAFTLFATAQIKYWIGFLDQKFAIANFLNYTDALSVNYTDDFLKKYVPNDNDGQDVIKKLLPKLSCGLKFVDKDLQPILKKKTIEYLGYDPNVPLEQQNVNYYDLAARAGHLLSSTDGQKAYYQSLADATDKATSKAATDEISSSGYKSVRTTFGTIKVPTSGIASFKAATYIQGLNVGNGQALKPTGKLAAQIMTSVINSLIFTGGSVISEAKTCIAPTKYDPIQAVAPPDNTPTTPDPSNLPKCDPNTSSCLDTLQPPPDPNQQDPNAAGLHMDKNPPTYKVGEVPKYQILGSTQPPGTQIKWKTEKIKDANGNAIQATPGEFSYCEIISNNNCAPQAVDADGNWPGANQFEPFYKGFQCGDEGVWRKTVLIGSDVFTLDYTVQANPNYNCTGAAREVIKPFAFVGVSLAFS